MKIAIGISGSSGAAYARVLLDSLQKMENLEIGLVVSEQAKVNWNMENPEKSWDSYPFRYYDKHDFHAPFASGSAGWDALVVCPCSAGFLAKAAHGLADDLMSRAAQVMLKERKKLILVLRETPFSLIHIENMRMVTLAGGIICPAIPSFYSGPTRLDELLATVTNRVIDLCGLDSKSYRWGG
jgi:4-hydroxy-3-polyprenylbenzoate decarboxylase